MIALPSPTSLSGRFGVVADRSGGRLPTIAAGSVRFRTTAGAGRVAATGRSTISTGAASVTVVDPTGVARPSPGADDNDGAGDGGIAALSTDTAVAAGATGPARKRGAIRSASAAQTSVAAMTAMTTTAATPPLR